MHRIRPPRLHPGDRVAVVAASGPVDRDKFEAGIEALSTRYQPVFDATSVYARAGFLAGDDAHRLQALQKAIADPDTRAVFLARGGYGLTRIASSLDKGALREHAKPIVGYSDVTALLTVCANAGVAAVHGPMVSDLARLCDRDRASLVNLLENPAPGVILSDLEAMVGGAARGPLLGGNLEVLTRLLGTPLQPDFRGAVLFLEEVGELPYRVDRALTHLETAGVLEAVSGVLLGDFTDCDEVENGEVKQPSAAEVVSERLGRLSVPVALGGAFGHGENKMSLPYGVTVELDTEAGRLTALEGAVS